MSDLTQEDVSAAILEMRDLLRLIAEPAIAERDQKRRTALKEIVGASAAKASSVLLMDGTHAQSEIQKATGINQGYLSTLVKSLKAAQLLTENAKEPRLAISIPLNFFEKDDSK